MFNPKKVWPGDEIAVWFSCGAASAVAAKLILEQYGATNRVHIVNNPVIEELSDNRRFLADVSTALDVDIDTATHPDYPKCSAWEVWERRKYMAGVSGAPCTQILKKQARQFWETRHPNVKWHVLGFTAEERKRHRRFTLTERSNVIPVLIDAGVTKQECIDVVHSQRLELPEAYRLGYPNANCRGCVKATSPTYWNHVRKVDPNQFNSRAEQSRRIGARLVRYMGKRIFLDELPKDAVGRPLASLTMPDCGIFCEET
jgi:hypothetical protein